MPVLTDVFFTCRYPALLTQTALRVCVCVHLQLSIAKWESIGHIWSRLAFMIHIILFEKNSVKLT